MRFTLIDTMRTLNYLKMPRSKYFVQYVSLIMKERNCLLAARVQKGMDMGQAHPHRSV